MRISLAVMSNIVRKIIKTQSAALPVAPYR